MPDLRIRAAEPTDADLASAAPEAETVEPLESVEDVEPVEGTEPLAEGDLK